ncbi:glycoside hydrolase family 97 catalytic domain-containing protein [Pelagicoccus sp. SDUM812005]|uniref:glycoside hydrolase family 97 protein n=1 Tax=Pelagicoccus sp. SDUM812005 TaxID=3041257 RepID=UPI00280FE2EC|nr:glycoside hydrolase family 97 catalytic domain-containing protein [Pelagicoccus sp. SDUM812005]MDQ8183469.1 glycoside hydrolase family 97 N-terminal domain-containing protein [Pelagicoccus sp. SDUM812005]
MNTYSIRRLYWGLLLLAAPIFALAKQETIRLLSPDGEKAFVLFPDEGKLGEEGITFSVSYGGRDVLQPSLLRLESRDIDFSGPFEVVSVQRRSVDSEWENRLGELSRVPDRFNELSVSLEGPAAKLTLVCRAYDEGVAFSYEIPRQGGLDTITLDDELVSYRFDADYPVWSTPKRERRVLTAQGEYRRIPLSQLEVGAERPLVVEMGEDCVIALAEAALVDFARLSFDADPNAEFGILSSLDGPMTRTVQDKVSGALQSERSEVAKIRSPLPLRSPWRVVMTGASHAELLENNYLILNLNQPSAVADTSWITPGKVLRSELTTTGGKAVIDYVAAHNMQYAHFDAGWYGPEMDDASDATTITVDPKRYKGELDLRALIDYANEKGVKVMLYVNRRALEKQLDELLPLFKEWGVAGIKFGFVRVGDQDATAWMHEAIEKAAEYEMVVDVHDEYRPTGVSRTYPNLLTQEGIRGDEEAIPNRHTLITMFTRMLAGAADNTVCYFNRRVTEKMGSHASQLAKTVCLFSPLQFLYWYDQPLESYENLGDKQVRWGRIGLEPELEFFEAVPTTWDETQVLVAEIGELGVIARRKGDEWFIGGINGENARTVDLDFSFLSDGVDYAAKLYTDDEKVDTRSQVRIETLGIRKGSSLSVELKANHGFAMRLRPEGVGE